MSQTDQIVFAESNAVQDINSATPFSNSALNYINDINSGVYTQSNTLVQFDLSSIYNSSSFVSPQSMYLVIPIVMSAAYTVTGSTAPVALANAGTYSAIDLVKLKPYVNLINGIELSIDGKTIEQISPNSNLYYSFKLISQMSQDYLNSYGPSLGIGNKLDSYQSIKYNTVTGATTTAASLYPCNGISNNVLYNTNPNFGEMSTPTVQWLNTYNQGLQDRSRYIDASNTATSTNANGIATFNGLSTIYGLTQLQNEYRPYYTVSAGTMTWVDYGIIKLSDVLDSFANIPVMQRLNAMLRFYVNTGSVVTSMSLVSASTCGYLLGSNSTFTGSNTCPFTIQNILGISVAGGATTFAPSANNLTVTMGVGRSAQSTIGGAALIPALSHPMSACRLYFNQVQIKPTLKNAYTSANRAKKVVYTSFVYNNFNNITSGANYSALLQGGVRNPRGILILPFISGSNTTNGNGISSGTFANTVPFSQFSSPFDTAPMTSGPISLTNINVQLGGTNVVQNAIQFSFEAWLWFVSLYEKVSTSKSIANGLFSQAYFEAGYRPYYIDLSRAPDADALTPKNLNVTFTNNSLLPIDVYMFTELFDEFTLDVVTGLIKK